MTVQELRELIGKKTEEINGYLESRDADKAEAALEEKKKLQKLLAVREAEDADEAAELRGQQRKKGEKRTVAATNELRAAVKFALKGAGALTEEERAAVNIDNNAAILPEQFVNDIQVLREGFPSLKEHSALEAKLENVVNFETRFCGKLEALNTKEYRVTWGERVFNIIAVDYGRYDRRKVVIKAQEVV